IDDHPMPRVEIMFVKDSAVRDIVLVVLFKGIHHGLGDDCVLRARKQPDLRASQMGRMINLARGSELIRSSDEIVDLGNGVEGIRVHAVMCRPPYTAVGTVIRSTRDDSDTADQA